MRISNVNNNNVLFKEKFNDILFPLLIKNLDDNSKVTFSINELNELLNENFTAQQLFHKIKYLLSYSTLSVSIKKDPNNSIFTFFNKTNKINRLSDILRVNLKEKIVSENFINYIKENYEFNVPVEIFKNVFKCEDYTTNNIYKILKEILENTIVEVSLLGNILYENKSVHIFKFHNKLYNIKEKYDNSISVNKEADEDGIEFMSYLRESEELEKEQFTKIEENIIKNGSELIKNQIINSDFTHNNENFKCNTYKCPVCKYGILTYPEIICPKCNTQILEKWD